jgi:DNA-binding MarR family transcriptional regulator
VESPFVQKSFVAFLLAQLGSHAAKQFAEQLAPLKLVPAHAGILRTLNRSSGISQRDLAGQLGMHASRLVSIVDELESLGLVVREGNAEDRRTNSLRITPQGREMLAKIATIGRQHNEALCAALNPEEREQLSNLLQRIADQQGLTRGVHPGLRRPGRDAACDDVAGKAEGSVP